MHASDAITVKDAAKAFGGLRAVDGVSLSVQTGEIFSVLGPSGCGKTTLLRMIMGFERADSGSISVYGRALDAPGVWIPPEQREIGMVVQDYALFPHLSVAKNVAFGLRKVARSDRRAVVQTALELVGLQHKSERYPHELSGGERQRVALARALAPEPKVVLLDEPFSSLDATMRSELRREVELILRSAGATTVIVTHDQEEALSISDRVAVMREGKVVQIGPPGDVYWQPHQRWTAQFVGEANILPGVVVEREVRTELGSFDLTAGAAATGTVHVAVRPEQLVIELDEMGNAEVTEREFRGHDVLYRLRHESGRQVLVQLPSIDMREIGDRVFVRPNGDTPVALVD